MSSPGIVIVGAGIGGLTAALCLAAGGSAVTLIERRTRLGETGAGLQLSPNASRILDQLGLAKAIHRVATEPERVVIRRIASGKRVGAVELGAFMRERFGAPYEVVLRADLHTILLDAVRARPNVKLLVGRTVTGIESAPSKAIVALESASGAREVIEADVVIGADGLRSTVREALGGSREPAYQGYTAWRASVPRGSVPEMLRRDETGLWLGRGRHVVHYPISAGRLVNIVAVLAGPEPKDDAQPEGAGPGRAFAGAASELRGLMAIPDEWSAWPLFDLPVGAMAKGRIALLGDAAHPVLPYLAQGAALAIEDAAILAACLAAHENGDPAPALSRYARLRRRRARRVQRQARRNGRAYHAGGLKALARDLVIRRLGERGMSERFAWLYGWTPDPSP